jgi:hypothetical protein
MRRIPPALHPRMDRRQREPIGTTRLIRRPIRNAGTRGGRSKPLRQPRPRQRHRGPRRRGRRSRKLTRPIPMRTLLRFRKNRRLPSGLRLRLRESRSMRHRSHPQRRGAQVRRLPEFQYPRLIPAARISRSRRPPPACRLPQTMSPGRPHHPCRKPRAQRGRLSHHRPMLAPNLTHRALRRHRHRLRTVRQPPAAHLSRPTRPQVQPGSGRPLRLLVTTARPQRLTRTRPLEQIRPVEYPCCWFWLG